MEYVGPLRMMQKTSTQASGLQVVCPLQDVTGETVDISEYIYFGFYDHVSYKENSGLGVTSICRWIGVSQRVVGLMPYWGLTQKRTMISRTTVQRLANIEKDTDKGRDIINKFDS